MNLIKYENYAITISDDAYLVKSIRKLFNNDKSKNKEKFFEQMTFLFFAADVRSDYNYIDDFEERTQAIIEGEGLSKDFKVTKDVQAAMDDYIRLTTTLSSQILADTKYSLNSLRKYVRNIDYGEVDDKGRLVNDPSKIATLMSKMPELAKQIVEMERIVNQELKEKGRARGSAEKSMFDDGFEGYD